LVLVILVPHASKESVAALIIVFEKSPDAIPKTSLKDSFKTGEPKTAFDPMSLSYVLFNAVYDKGLELV
jgi:hypothetical protein